MFTKEEAIADINQTQDSYVDRLVQLITGADASFSELREIDFTSPTGTGKTVMVAKLLNRLPDFFFVVTTLSRGQLRRQIEDKLNQLVQQNNFVVYGLNEFTKATKLQARQIEASIPWERKIVWVRDEGHIATNRWAEIFQKKVDCIVNFSATNKSNNGIQCSFTHTMMLRTVVQESGTPEDALDKLLEVKKAHKDVVGYNPCALFRVLNSRWDARIARACNERGLRFRNITEESFDIADLCKDDNEYDVIINKLKITEGIDLRRCHVIYMDSKPNNEATVIQVIGRARRNALFWRDDIDILDPSKADLLEKTRCCYVFYNIPETEVGVTENGELMYSLCDTISIEALKPGVTVKVTNGQLPNGLKVIELAGKTGSYHIDFDQACQCNIVDNPEFYELKQEKKDKLVVDFSGKGLSIKRLFLKPTILDFFRYEHWKGNWEHDRRKYWFYLVQKLGESMGSFADFEYWGRALRVDKKDTIVDRDTYHAFLRDPAVKDLLSVIRKDGIAAHIPLDWHAEARQFSKKGPSLISLEKKSFLVSGEDSAYLAPAFLPYVEKVEYYDLSPMVKIERAVAEAENVKMLGPNRFRICNHPDSYYLQFNRGIATFEEFRKAIAQYRGKTIFSKKLEYWKEALETVKSYPQLDRYDSKVVNLEEINRVLGIGLSKKAIQTISSGNLVVRTRTSENLSRLPIYGMTSNGMFDWIGKKGILYRRDFVDRYIPYEKTINDREIAIVGPDTMKYVNGKYVEDLPVTSKISRFSKFRRFISTRYATFIEDASNTCFSGHNDFGFDSKCNSCLGFCVEYFAKIKLYGDEFYKSFVKEAMSEAKVKEPNDIVRVRAAMLIYREAMVACYGSGLAGIIPTISVADLVQENYEPFVKKVIELGLKTKDFVSHELYGDQFLENLTLHDPNLSVNHISALCDFITQDTILDVKCTSSITPQHVLQVLAYHYLSTKRSDLSIKRVIVYEAVTGKSLTINIPSK